MLTQRSGLAKESVTPGKTQLINYFIVNDQRYLVDLPGYGYAKSSLEDRRYWMDTTQKFFTSRTTLRRIFVLVDGNINPQDIDMEFCKVLDSEGIGFDIIMTKIDKSNQGEVQKNLKMLKHRIQEALGRQPRIF
jgi:GTP-binding protein